jgi:hypothetical protein
MVSKQLKHKNMKGFYGKYEIVLINEKGDKEYFPISLLSQFQNIFKMEKDDNFPLKSVNYALELKRNITTSVNIPIVIKAEIADILSEYYPNSYKQEIMDLLDNMALKTK